MGEEQKENKDDFKQWLLGLEKQIGKPIVVTLSIRNSHIDFIAAHDYRKYIGEPEHEPDDESPITIDAARNNLKMSAVEHIQMNYIR